MPQDSLNIVIHPGDSVYSIADSLLGTLPPEMASQIVRPEEPNPALPPLFVLLVIIFAFLLSRWIAYLNGSGINRKLLKEYIGKQVQYDKWLQLYNPYYRSLAPTLQLGFRKRLLLFMAARRFHFLELNEEERIKVLISAAAVQITFGLKNYLLAYFTDIYIIQRNYHYGLHTMPFEGHVSSNGIYLSWENFEQEFRDYSDGSNVGLHEMAHALAYVNFSAEFGRDEAFRKRFREFSTVGQAIFSGMQKGKTNMLGSYAATSYDEFWAGCVENFFERPQELKTELPELYNELAVLLNQNPLSQNFLNNLV